jgi:23S rRNA (uracil1939-C5)-methyltransferase
MNIKPNSGQLLKIRIRTLGVHGEGVGDWQGYTLFVDGALPGEEVEVRVVLAKKNYGVGVLTKILTPSPDRISPICPLADRCGGCQVMPLDYSAQLAQKRQRVVDAFERIGKLTDVEVLPCVPSPDPLHYRNKIQAPIQPDGQGIRIGFYARNSHELVDVDTCYIHCELGQKIYEEAVSLLKESGLPAYDRNTGKGELRHLIVKTAVQTGQALVVIVTRGKVAGRLKEIALELRRRCPEVRGVIQNSNPGSHNVVLGNAYELLDGSLHMEEEILGLRFRVSPASFFQVNPLQAHKLYGQVIEWAELTGTETVLDAYCGVGTMTLLLARGAKKVLGVECVPQAIHDARENAALNGIANIEFVCAEAEEWIRDCQEVDAVILNPPRKGCHPSLIHELGNRKPDRVVYVSCDPATLARDLALLRELGYRIDKAQPFDMFPQTAHVETVVKLSRQ